MQGHSSLITIHYNLTLVDVPNEDMTDEELLSDNDDPTKRLIKYHLGPDFLHL